jgi:uncharacterized protein (DUF4415 family)
MTERRNTSRKQSSAKRRDDAPELSADWFARADLMKGGKIVRRGRPKGSGEKELISLRLDKKALAAYRATGPNWQVRINDAVVKGVRSLRVTRG